MRTFFQKTLFVASLGVIASMFVGCTSDDDTTTSSSKPTISSITVDEDTLTASSASATISFTTATQIYYVCVKGSSSSFSAGSATFETLEVSTSDKEVTLDFTDLVAQTSYVIAAYAANDDMETGVSTYDFTTPAEEVVEVPDDGSPAVYAISINSEGTELTLSVRNATQYEYHIYPQDEEPEDGTFVWIDEAIDEDGDYTVSIEYLTTGNYVIAAYASYYGTEEENYEKVSGDITTFEFSYEMTVDSYFTISNIVYSPTMVTFDIDITEGSCSGVAITVARTDYYSDSVFSSMVAAGTSSEFYIEEDTTSLSCCTDAYNSYSSFLTPNLSYTLAAVALVESSSYTDTFEQTVYTYETRGSVWSYEETTPAFTIGSSDAVVTIEEIETSKTIVSLAIKTTQGTNAVGYILGYTPKEDITSDIQTWIESTDYLNGKSYSLIEFGDSSTSSTQTISGLTQGTEYEVFAVGLTAEGYLGELVTLNTSTESMETNDGIEYTAEVIPASYRATLEVEFGANCDKIYYCNGIIVDSANSNYQYYEENSMTDEVASSMLTTYMATGANSISASDAVDGVVSLALTTGYTTYSSTQALSIKADNDYVMYLIAVDADGAVDEMRKIEYTTPEVTFDNEATVSLSLYETTTSSYDTPIVWLEVEMSNGATSYYYASQGISASEWSITDPNDLTAFGKAALIYGKEWTASMISVELLKDDSVAVVIPMDKYGRYGTPVVYRAE
ncbi:MAG: hypothetical protein SNI20_07315 [Rikenellaceae bacterium]